MRPNYWGLRFGDYFVLAVLFAVVGIAINESRIQTLQREENTMTLVALTCSIAELFINITDSWTWCNVSREWSR